jgi:ribose-phosphate pyrophosphokinase
MVDYKCSVIANPDGNAWNFACEVFQHLRKRSEKFELNKVNIKRFRDGEIKPHIESNVRQKNCFFIHDSSLQPSEWLTQLLLINETLKNSSSQKVIDVLPYIKYARQDRKDESRVPISARAVANAVELYADAVLTMDVHNPAIQGFYKIPFDNLYSFMTIAHYLKIKHPELLDNLVIMSPDVGGAARARAFAKKIGVGDIVIGNKVRTDAGSVAEFRLIGDVAGKNVIIIDDMIDSGGTLCKACSAAKQAGARKVIAYATHALFTEGVAILCDCFDLIIVSDSVPVKIVHPKIETISLAELFADAIYRINEGMSLSELFTEGLPEKQMFIG